MGAANPTTMKDYVDEDNGFLFRYPEYWTIVDDVSEILAVQDGEADLIREEDLTTSDRNGYKALIHVDGTHQYLSNIAFLVLPHIDGGGNVYDSSESASQAVKQDFEQHRASGTYFLEETYLGESHTYVYRRSVPVEQWDDSVRMTYYITASRSHAYMLVETLLPGSLDDIHREEFNQIIHSFRILENEVFDVEPGLGWGVYRPGEDPAQASDIPGEVGELEIRENFSNNSFGWPDGDDSYFENGRYILDSSEGFPFTVTNNNLGGIRFDFSYEGETEFLEGDEYSGYGLVFAYKDRDNYYAFLINAAGQYLVVKESNGQIAELIPWKISANLGSDPHVLMVQGNYQSVNEPVSKRYELVFYVDGVPIDYVIAEDFVNVSGKYGLFISSGMEVAFDNLETRNYLLDGFMSFERLEH
ncbi:MAG TPA: hypothetical protein VGB30_00365 [bacterium]|jgi:hypothetical protein